MLSGVKRGRLSVTTERRVRAGKVVPRVFSQRRLRPHHPMVSGRRIQQWTGYMTCSVMAWEEPLEGRDAWQESPGRAVACTPAISGHSLAARLRRDNYVCL